MSDEVSMSVQSSFPAPESETPFTHSQQQKQQQQQQQTFTFPAPENAHDAEFGTIAESGPEPNYTQGAQPQPSLHEMEQDAAKLRELNSQLDSLQPLQEQQHQAIQFSADPLKTEADAKSVYVGNVDYGTTPLELQQHFSSSGVVERITILSNKQTGKPKGFAYLEFALSDGANKAVATLDRSMFRERELKVSLKRTNIPGISNISGRGGRFRGRGGFRGLGNLMMMRGRVRGGGFRGRGAARGASRFSPY